MTQKNKYVEIAREIVLKNIDKEKYSVFLFGSRVNETNPYNSDIDIGIIGEQPLGKLYYKIIDDLESSIIPFNIDIVDFTEVKEDFKKMVLEGEIIVWNRGKYLEQNYLHTSKR